MNIDEVIANLTRTIAGKKLFVIALMGKRSRPETIAESLVADAMIPMIDLNVKELEAILADLEKVKNGS